MKPVSLLVIAVVIWVLSIAFFHYMFLPPLAWKLSAGYAALFTSVVYLITGLIVGPRG